MLFEVVALQIAHPVEPFTIESYFLLGIHSPLIRHSHIHQPLYLIYDKIRLELLGDLPLPETHQPVEQLVTH